MWRGQALTGREKTATSQRNSQIYIKKEYIHSGCLSGARNKVGKRKTGPVLRYYTAQRETCLFCVKNKTKQNKTVKTLFLPSVRTTCHHLSAPHSPGFQKMACGGLRLTSLCMKAEAKGPLRLLWDGFLRTPGKAFLVLPLFTKPLLQTGSL